MFIIVKKTGSSQLLLEQQSPKKYWWWSISFPRLIGKSLRVDVEFTFFFCFDTCKVSCALTLLEFYDILLFTTLLAAFLVDQKVFGMNGFDQVSRHILDLLNQ